MLSRRTERNSLAPREGSAGRADRALGLGVEQQHLGERHGELRLLALDEALLDGELREQLSVPQPKVGELLVAEVLDDLDERVVMQGADLAVPELTWLEPPRPNGTLTVADVLAADDHRAAVRAWARDVWDAWSAHHATVESWLEHALD